MMFGAFILTVDDHILFSQLGRHTAIKEIRFATEYSLATAVLADGTQEHFTEPLTDGTARALMNSEQVLVGEIDEEQKLLCEYYVPVVLI